jgi:hypothetical protein
MALEDYANKTPGITCKLCQLTPEQRTDLRKGRAQGMHYGALSRWLKGDFGLSFREAQIGEHFRKGHEE